MTRDQVLARPSNPSSWPGVTPTVSNFGGGRDALRPLLLANVFEAVIDAGATTINIPDTVGYAIPYDYGDFVRALMDRIANIDKAIVSVHCHDDLGCRCRILSRPSTRARAKWSAPSTGLGSAPEMQVSKKCHGAQDPS